MKFVTTAAVAALLVGSLGVANLVPAFADDAAAPASPGATTAAPPPAGGPARPWGHGRLGHPGMGMPGMGMPGMATGGMGGGLLAMACGDRGAEALEIAFVHVQYQVKPNATQQPLFDTLKTAALADQKTFADACKTAMGSTPAAKPTILDKLQGKLAIETAEVAALNDVVPKFKAFYDSLDDGQKAKLEPRRWSHPQMGGNGQGRWSRQGNDNRGMQHNRPGRMADPAHANAPDAVPGDAPSAPDTITPSNT